MCSAEFVKDAVLREKKAVKISEFLERFVSKLSGEGVTAPSYRPSNLKNRLIKSFWEQTFVLPVQSQSEIVYSSQVTTGEVVETIVNTSGEQWTDEDGTEEVPSEAKKNEKYFLVYHSCKSRSYQDGGIVVFSLKKECGTAMALDCAFSCLFC